MPLSPIHSYEIVPWGYGWGLRVASGIGVPFRFADTLEEARSLATSACRRRGQSHIAVLDRLGNTVEVHEIAA